MMTRARAGPPLLLRDGDRAVEIVIKFLSTYMFVTSQAPLETFGTARGSWSVSTQVRVTGSLRGVVALAGMPAAEYTLHFLHIGGATFASAGGRWQM